MPERPDLDAWIPRLRAEVLGRRIVGVHVKEPIVVRCALDGGLVGALTGATVTDVVRHGVFFRFTLSGSAAGLLAVNPMLAGRFSLVSPSARDPADRCVTLGLDDGRELRYRDDRKMGKVYAAATEAGIPGFAVGLDVLAPSFTVAVLGGLLKKRRDQIKAVLLDHAALDSFGNAYADETLWHARVHPKLRANELDTVAVARLHAAMVSTLTEATAEIIRRNNPFDEKVRDFLGVRNRKGQPCPVCATPVRVVGMQGHDAFFCPTCQPDTKGRGFVDWSRAGNS